MGAGMDSPPLFLLEDEMRIVIVKTETGLRGVVASRQTAVMRWLRAQPGWATGNMIWRYHDGSGWADGSHESWMHINSVTTVPLHVVY
jgi:hypothetical protein